MKENLVQNGVRKFKKGNSQACTTLSSSFCILQQEAQLSFCSVTRQPMRNPCNSATEPSLSSHEPSFKTAPPKFLLKEHPSHLFSRLAYGSP